MSLEMDMENNKKEIGTIYQVSIMNALLEGVYEGETTIRTLAKNGDFGLGTFNKLDGELIAYKGDFYQIRCDGTSERANPDEKVPFAAVTTFQPEITHEIEQPIDKAGLDKIVKELIGSENLFYGIYVKGNFEKVRTRTVSIQEKPYRPFTEVVEGQAEFDFKDSAGELVGFFSPAYVQGITISGYHLHFLTDNKKGGGHVLDFILKNGTLQIQTLPNYKVILPEQEDFEHANLSGDTSADIIKTEG